MENRERAMWLAVVMTALEDLKGKKAEVYEEARSWIFDEPDFETVCGLAGIEAEAIREKVRAQLPKQLKAA